MDRQKLIDTVYNILNTFYYEDVDGMHFNYPQTVNKIIELIDKEKSDCKDELINDFINRINKPWW